MTKKLTLYLISVLIKGKNMKYLIACSLIWCALIISKKPKEPTDPTGPKEKKQIEVAKARS